MCRVLIFVAEVRAHCIGPLCLSQVPHEPGRSSAGDVGLASRMKELLRTQEWFQQWEANVKVRRRQGAHQADRGDPNPTR
jgi:hypothetical protein